MAWNRKLRGPERGYFYLSRRVGGQARKVYLGRGPLAERVAAMAAEGRERKAAAGRARRDEELLVKAAEARLVEAGRQAALLVWAALVLAGYRRHRGCWRRRRDVYDAGRRAGGAGRRGPG